MVAELWCRSWSGGLGSAKVGKLGRLGQHSGDLTEKKLLGVLWSTATTSTWSPTFHILAILRKEEAPKSEYVGVFLDSEKAIKTTFSGLGTRGCIIGTLASDFSLTIHD